VRAGLRLVVAATLLASAAAAEDRKTVAECIAIALANQPNLKAAGATLEAGHARTWQAISGALPQVTANYSANRRNTSATARTGAPIGGAAAARSNTFNFYSTGVSLSQIDRKSVV